MSEVEQGNWLKSQDPNCGYPDAIPLALSEGELVALQEALEEARSSDARAALRRKLRAIQIEAFARAHG